MKHTKSLLPICPLLVVGIIGCAGGGDDPSTGQNPLEGDNSCYSPTQNLDIAYEPDTQGCACEATDAAQCVPDSTGRRVALICESGKWLAVEDGPCQPEPPLPPPAPLNAPTITEGVFGFVTTWDDVGDPAVHKLADFGIEVFTSRPPPTPEDGLIPLAKTKSNEVGFYEIALPAGDYFICTTFRRCTDLKIIAGQTIRKDYEYSIGPGWE